MRISDWSSDVCSSDLDRLAAIAEAKAAIEARARERDAHEQAVYQAKLAQREAKRKATGKKPGGKPPTPPTAGPRADDQINLTDADSRIMKTSGGGFEQCYNGQAVVDSESMRSEEHPSEPQSIMRISYA